MDPVLKMLKIDLGINHSLRDEYLNKHIESCNAELSKKGITLDFTKAEDIMLLSDYAAWQYRKRMENVPISQNLQFRIRNRQVKGRAIIV